MAETSSDLVGPIRFSRPVPLDEIVDFLSRLTLWDSELQGISPYVCTLDFGVAIEGWAGSQDSLLTKLPSYVTRVQKVGVGGIFYVGLPVVEEVADGKKVNISLKGKFPYEVQQEIKESGGNEVAGFTGLKLIIDPEQLGNDRDYYSAAMWLNIQLRSQMLK